MTLRAYCYRSGQIEFTTDQLPEGTLPIAAHDNHGYLKDTVFALARHSYEGKPLVPGLPEADDHSAAFDALNDFMKRVETALERG